MPVLCAQSKLSWGVRQSYLSHNPSPQLEPPSSTAAGYVFLRVTLSPACSPFTLSTNLAPVKIIQNSINIQQVPALQEGELLKNQLAQILGIEPTRKTKDGEPGNLRSWSGRSADRALFGDGFASATATPRTIHEVVGGVNWYLNRLMRISADYSRSNFGGGAVSPRESIGRLNKCSSFGYRSTSSNRFHRIGGVNSA